MHFPEFTVAETCAALFAFICPLAGVMIARVLSKILSRKEMFPHNQESHSSSRTDWPEYYCPATTLKVRNPVLGDQTTKRLHYQRDICLLRTIDGTISDKGESADINARKKTLAVDRT